MSTMCLCPNYAKHTAAPGRSAVITGATDVGMDAGGRSVAVTVTTQNKHTDACCVIPKDKNAKFKRKYTYFFNHNQSANQKDLF